MTACADIDECKENDGAGDCDILAQKIGACHTLENATAAVCTSPCLNEVPLFRCGGCPQGFEGTADKSRGGRGCFLPDVGNSSDQAAVQLKSQVKLTAPVAVLEEGSDARRQYIEALVVELAKEMRVDPSEIDVKGLTQMPGHRVLQAGRRTLAEADEVVNVQLDFVLKSANPSQAIQSLNARLADPAATLGAAAATAANDGEPCTACIAHRLCQKCKLGASPVATCNPGFGDSGPGGACAAAPGDCQCAAEQTFVCPAGKILPDGGSACQSCPHPQHTPDATSCQDCGANKVPNAEGSGCICDDGYYDARGGRLVCYDTGEDWADVAQDSTECLACAGAGGKACVDCQGGAASVKEGFAISDTERANGERHRGGLAGPLAVFKCPLGGCVAGNRTQPTGHCGAGYACASRVTRYALH
jgi:hypothetical protein